jgi:hypothetical protein
LAQHRGTSRNDKGSHVSRRMGLILISDDDPTTSQGPGNVREGGSNLERIRVLLCPFMSPRSGPAPIPHQAGVNADEPGPGRKTQPRGL